MCVTVHEEIPVQKVRRIPLQMIQVVNIAAADAKTYGNELPQRVKGVRHHLSMQNHLFNISLNLCRLLLESTKPLKPLTRASVGAKTTIASFMVYGCRVGYFNRTDSCRSRVGHEVSSSYSYLLTVV
jgi:hypothetical protein